MPGSAVGSTTFQTTWVGVQPMPTAASFILVGTADRLLGGQDDRRQHQHRQRHAAGERRVGAVRSTTTAKANTPARIEGKPVSTLAGKRATAASRLFGPISAR